MKLDKIIGSVETGKQADLLILNSNPLKDINAYNDIESVIIRGMAVKRTELSATRR
jgi:imidazolonepropionase-like amidohydrolase